MKLHPLNTVHTTRLYVRGRDLAKHLGFPDGVSITKCEDAGDIGEPAFWLDVKISPESLPLVVEAPMTINQARKANGDDPLPLPQEQP